LLLDDPIYIAGPDGSPRKLLDSSYLNNLGWKLKVGLKSRIKKTIEWYKKEKVK